MGRGEGEGDRDDRLSSEATGRKEISFSLREARSISGTDSPTRHLGIEQPALDLAE